MKFTMAILIGSIAIALLALSIEAHSEQQSNLMRVLMGKSRVKRELVLFKTREQEAEEAQQKKLGVQGNADTAKKLTREELEQKERDEWDKEEDDNNKQKETARAHVHSSDNEKEDEDDEHETVDHRKKQASTGFPKQYNRYAKSPATTEEPQTITHRSSDNKKKHEDDEHEIVHHRKNQASTGFPKPSNFHDMHKQEEVKPKKSRKNKTKERSTGNNNKAVAKQVVVTQQSCQRCAAMKKAKGL